MKIERKTVNFRVALWPFMPFWPALAGLEVSWCPSYPFYLIFICPWCLDLFHLIWYVLIWYYLILSYMFSPPCRRCLPLGVASCSLGVCKRGMLSHSKSTSVDCWCWVWFDLIFASAVCWATVGVEFNFRLPPVLHMPSQTAKLPFYRWHFNKSRIIWRGSYHEWKTG